MLKINENFCDKYFAVCIEAPIFGSVFYLKLSIKNPVSMKGTLLNTKAWWEADGHLTNFTSPIFFRNLFQQPIFSTDVSQTNFQASHPFFSFAPTHMPDNRIYHRWRCISFIFWTWTIFESTNKAEWSGPEDPSFNIINRRVFFNMPFFIFFSPTNPRSNRFLG